MTSPLALTLRLDGTSPEDPAALTRPVVVLEAVAHPELVAAMAEAGATRRGAASWSYSSHDGVGRQRRPTDHAPLRAALELCGNAVVGDSVAVTGRGAPRMLSSRAHWSLVNSVTESLRGAPNLHLLGRAAAYGAHPLAQAMNWSSAALLMVSYDNHSIWLRAHTHHIKDHDGDSGPFNFNQRPAGRQAKPVRPVTGLEALQALQWLQQNKPGVDVVDPAGFTSGVRTKKAARQLARQLADDPRSVLRDIDTLRLLVAKLGRSETAELLGFTGADIDAAEAAHTDVHGKLTATARRSVVVVPEPGKPARAKALVGARAPQAARRLVQAGHRTPQDQVVGIDRLPVTSAYRIDADVAASLAALDADEVVIDSAVLDVAAMAAAKPVDDPRLFDYQQVMVGRFLATSRGLGNFCAPGAGKTPTTLAGFDAAARTTPSYRALVVSEANARFQWFDHANEWCPDFHVALIDSRAKLDELRATLAGAGDEPVLVITSYALAADVADAVDAIDALTSARSELVGARTALARELDRRNPSGDKVTALRAAVTAAEQAVTEAQGRQLDPTEHLGAALHQVSWHDIAADEVVGLRSSSKTGRALWALRSHSRRALVLTGTPINRDVDDVARLLSWAFGDRRAWYGIKPSDHYDLTDVEDAKRLLADLGPTVYRVDKSEIDVELPELEVAVVPLKLRREELALAQAARTELKEKFTELMANLDLAAEKAQELADAGDESAQLALREAKEALREAKGAWLGSTTLARQAAASPIALSASQTAGAELLRINGLVDAACRQIGTKRRWAGEYIEAAVEADRQVVLFTEFATVARALVDDLRERGLRVGEVLGGGGARRDQAIRDYRAAELDVLICTSAGERGLNLQTRNGDGQVLIHFDLPWTASGVVQRTGRVERIGGADHVQVVFPIASGTIEDRVAGLVVARAAAALQALDVPRGIKMDDTDFGRALGSLALDVDASALRGGERALLEMTRVLLAGEGAETAEVPQAA